MRHAFAALVLLLAACDSTAPLDAPGTDAPGTDAPIAPGTDAPIAPGTDAPVGTDAPTVGARSAGCGMATSAAPATWVEETLTVGGGDRPYFVYLPTGYDPTRAYPIIYQLHGCSDSATREDNNVPVHRETGADAILVRGRAAARCWDTNPSGVDVPYFDAMLEAAESTLCVDTERRFVSGYSGGSFMAHALACTHGSLLRGVATIAGGQAGRMCTGNVAALLIHDLNDGTVNISASEGARDNHAMRNGCDVSATRTPTADPPCEAYAGCDPGLPVVWCQTTGEDHSRQDALAAPIFWNFFSSL
jgi:polyhydroxybutyrate depolymerase